MADSPTLLRLMDNLRLELPGAVDGMIQLQLFNAVSDFCDRTNAWRCYNDIITEVDVDIYALYPSVSGAVAKRLLSAANADANGPTYTGQAALLTPNRVALSRVPDQPMTLRLYLALIPGELSTKQVYPPMPDWFWLDYFEAIKAGVLARMMSQIAKPYSNPTMAGAHLRMYTRAVMEARTSAQDGRIYGGQNWRFPQTFQSTMRRGW